jgi:hypothetical protein
MEKLTRTRRVRLFPDIVRRRHGNSIRGTTHSLSALVQNVRINHRRADILVTEQFLDRPDIVTVNKQVRGERVAKRVARYPLPNIGAYYRAANCLGNGRFVKPTQRTVGNQPQRRLTQRSSHREHPHTSRTHIHNVAALREEFNSGESTRGRPAKSGLEGDRHNIRSTFRSLSAPQGPNIEPVPDFAVTLDPFPPSLTTPT